MQEDVVVAASKKDGVVEHPLLDKVRACSSNPDDAADFFLQLLHPYPLCRMSVEAQAHIWQRPPAKCRHTAKAHL